MTNDKKINVLYVDDIVGNLESFKASFRRDFNVFVALSAMEAEQILDTEKDIHVLIVDQKMPVKLGTDLLAETVLKYPYQIRILLTAYTDVEAIIDAINRGQIFRYLTKPWNYDELKKSIEDGYADYSKIMEEKEAIKNLTRIIEELNAELKRKQNE